MCADFEQLNLNGIAQWNLNKNRLHTTSIEVKRCKSGCIDEGQMNDILNQLDVEFFYLDSQYNAFDLNQTITNAIVTEKEEILKDFTKRRRISLMTNHAHLSDNVLGRTFYPATEFFFLNVEKISEKLAR